MSSFTPGPWHVALDGRFIVDHGSNIAELNPREVSPHEMEANAKLIAAAPDIFEALDRAYRFLTENFTASDMPDIIPLCQDALARVSA